MALSRHHAAAAHPMSINELITQAVQYDFVPDVALQRWIRAAKLLLTEAAICEQDGNLQLAFLYLYRHANLVLEKLPTHPDYRDPTFRDDIRAAYRACQRNMAKLETMKPRIQAEHERYMQAVQRRNAERARAQAERQQLTDQLRRASLASEEGWSDDGRPKSLVANENSDLAVDLAHREIRRRDASRRTTREAGISPGTVASRRRGIVVQASDENVTVDADLPSRPVDSVDTGVKEAAQFLPDNTRQSWPGRTPASQSAASSAYQYPTVPAKEGTMDWNLAPLRPTTAYEPPRPAPPRPAKDSLPDFAPLVPARPDLPTSVRSPTATPSPPPSSQKLPSKYTFKPTAFTEAGAPLRTVLLPSDLRTTFLNLAHPNTVRQLETCGILCATLISNALFISHLIVPDQTSTSETCDTTESGDNDLFDYCDSNSLLVCGWIHTHPTQSCFLSSRDLHTSSGYQVMLPEAIAIVCAPRHMPDWGIFRLTDPPGLQAVLGCRQTATFHPHAETNLYTDALRPGHVVEAKGLRFEVVDMRKQS